MLEERDDREKAAPRGPERRGTKRHYQAVIQAEIRRLARALDSDRVSKHEPVESAVTDSALSFGEFR